MSIKGREKWKRKVNYVCFKVWVWEKCAAQDDFDHTRGHSSALVAPVRVWKVWLVVFCYDVNFFCIFVCVYIFQSGFHTESDSEALFSPPPLIHPSGNFKWHIGGVVVGVRTPSLAEPSRAGVIQAITLSRCQEEKNGWGFNESGSDRRHITTGFGLLGS